MDGLFPDAVGWVGPHDTAEVQLAAKPCVSPLALTLGSITNPWVLVLEMCLLDILRISSLVMTAALVGMVRVSPEVEGASA